MNHITYSFTVDTFLMIVIWNIIGTGLQVGLAWIHEKKKWIWPDTALKVVNFLMSMTALLIANRKHPLTGSEAEEVPEPDKSKLPK